MKTNSLHKKFDKIRFLEENNKLVSKDQNRLLNKFLNNKLAVLPHSYLPMIHLR
jgi:hypothetical protein